jgi:hypothetical protein
VPKSTVDHDTYSVPVPSFRLWLDHRLEAVPDVASLALARSGAAGASRDDLRRLAGIPPGVFPKASRLCPETSHYLTRACGESVQGIGLVASTAWIGPGKSRYNAVPTSFVNP